MKRISRRSQWSRDYAISAIHFDRNHESIEKVRAHAFQQNGALGAARTIDKLLVIGLLLGGNRVVTLRADDRKGWTPGPDVHRVYSDEHIFISTNPEEKSGDNLGSLPEF